MRPSPVDERLVDDGIPEQHPLVRQSGTSRKSLLKDDCRLQRGQSPSASGFAHAVGLNNVCASTVLSTAGTLTQWKQVGLVGFQGADQSPVVGESDRVTKVVVVVFALVLDGEF